MAGLEFKPQPDSGDHICQPVNAGGGGRRVRLSWIRPHTCFLPPTFPPSSPPPGFCCPSGHVLTYPEFWKLQPHGWGWRRRSILKQFHNAVHVNAVLRTASAKEGGGQGPWVGETPLLLKGREADDPKCVSPCISSLLRKTFGNCYHFLLQMRKLRAREVKWLVKTIQ